MENSDIILSIVLILAPVCVVLLWVIVLKVMRTNPYRNPYEEPYTIIPSKEHLTWRRRCPHCNK